jgi:hypothetical protein
VEGKNKLACPVFSSTWILRASFCRRTCLSWSDNFATLSCFFSYLLLSQAEGKEDVELRRIIREKEGRREEEGR